MRSMWAPVWTRSHLGPGGRTAASGDRARPRAPPRRTPSSTACRRAGRSGCPRPASWSRNRSWVRKRTATVPGAYRRRDRSADGGRHYRGDRDERAPDRRRDDGRLRIATAWRGDHEPSRRSSAGAPSADAAVDALLVELRARGCTRGAHGGAAPVRAGALPGRRLRRCTSASTSSRRSVDQAALDAGRGRPDTAGPTRRPAGRAGGGPRRLPTRSGASTTGLDDAVGATPSARLRVGVDPDGYAPVAGYAVTGRAGSRGYLQRLAVDPRCQRRGLGDGPRRRRPALAAAVGRPRGARQHPGGERRRRSPSTRRSASSTSGTAWPCCATTSRRACGERRADPRPGPPAGGRAPRPPSRSDCPRRVARSRPRTSAPPSSRPRPARSARATRSSSASTPPPSRPTAPSSWSSTAASAPAPSWPCPCGATGSAAPCTRSPSPSAS